MFFFSIKCLFIFFIKGFKCLMNGIKMNFTAWTRRKYAIYIGKRFRLQQESRFKQIWMPLWLSGCVCFSVLLIPRAYWRQERQHPQPLLFNLVFYSAFIRHVSEGSPRPPPPRCCATPLTSLVPDVAHPFQTFVLSVNPYQFLLWELIFSIFKEVFLNPLVNYYSFYFSHLFLSSTSCLRQNQLPLRLLCSCTSLGQGPIPSLPYI